MASSGVLTDFASKAYIDNIFENQFSRFAFLSCHHGELTIENHGLAIYYLLA